jgi:acyl-CoA synthetase (AMP-forming)/AMP-acid ligase II
MPGWGVDIVDDDGLSVGPGQVGELIMRNPSMSLTVGLWNDPDQYIDSYLSRFPDIWVHGDLCSRDEDGLWSVRFGLGKSGVPPGTEIRIDDRVGSGTEHSLTPVERLGE